jgi:hypothetical protein
MFRNQIKGMTDPLLFLWIRNRTLVRKDREPDQAIVSDLDNYSVAQYGIYSDTDEG